MTALDDRPVCTTPTGGADGAPAPADSVRLLCDGLPSQAAGPRFRFSEPNPVAAGRTYAQSLFQDLPYMVGVLVRRELHLTEPEWNDLVTTGGALDVTGPGECRMPFTLDAFASAPYWPDEQAPKEVCPDCWGSGYSVDDDATMTGALGRLFVCFCARGSA